MSNVSGGFRNYIEDFVKKFKINELIKKLNILYYWQKNYKYIKIYNFLRVLRSVWIQLIFAKIENWNWKHCSEIIFKCVNSIVGPIFNEKVAEKWNLWVCKQYTMCTDWFKKSLKSQSLRLLFIEQYMNSNHNTQKAKKRVKKKKKKNVNADAEVFITIQTQPKSWWG